MKRIMKAHGIEMKRFWAVVFVCLGICMKSAVVDAASQSDYVVTEAEYKVDPTDKISDAKGIQSILDKAIGSKTVITIYFPAGTYYVDRTLKVYSNTHIILDEKATVYRMDSLINNGILHNVDQNGKRDVVGGYNMSENITLEGGIWDGGNIKKASKGTDVIRFDHARNITIKDCVIKNTYDCHIVELVGVKNGLISGCTLTGFRYKKGKEKDYTYAREAVQLESAWTSNEADLTDVSSAWAKGSVIDGTSCQQITVTDNQFIDMPCGVGQHRYTKSGKYRNKDITISNNTFNCSTKLKYCKIAITCSGTNNLNVFNNTIKGPYRFAMHIIASDGVTIEKNQIDGIKMNGIMVDKGNVIAIQENQIKNIGKHGISIGGGTVGDITKNIINKTKQNGICVNAGKITNIAENIIKNVNKHGISIIGGTIGTGKKNSKGIQGNKITTCKQNGISVSGKGRVSAIGNNKITGVKNNGISLTEKAKVYWVVKNTIKKCRKHGIWNGTKVKTKIKKNKGKTK